MAAVDIPQGTQNVDRLLPSPREWDRGYWEAAKEGRLVVQACSECGRVRNLPKIGCPHCGSFEFEWRQSAGKGTIYSWTAAWNGFHPKFADLPFTLAIVELDDYPEVHLVTNLVGLPDEAVADETAVGRFVKIGARVEVAFESFGDTVLPQFRLA